MSALRTAMVLNKPVFYTGAPLGVFLLPYAASLAGLGGWMYSESGVIEWLTVLFLIVAIAALAMSLREASRLDVRVFVWVILLLLGAVYFCGEEISWGQWVFRWSTPDAWRVLNDQQETNLHNLRGIGFLMDQFPRLGLSLAAFIGGICVPLYRFVRDVRPPPVTQWQGWWPTMACLPAAALALLVRPVETLAHSAAAPPWMQAGSGELKECLLALFIMIYAGILRRRIVEARTTCS